MLFYSYTNVAQVLSHYWAKEHLPVAFVAPQDLIKNTGVATRAYSIIKFVAITDTYFLSTMIVSIIDSYE